MQERNVSKEVQAQYSGGPYQLWVQEQLTTFMELLKPVAKHHYKEGETEEKNVWRWSIR